MTVSIGLNFLLRVLVYFPESLESRPMKPSILPMQESDLTDIAVLAQELGYPSELSELLERFQHLSSRDNHALLVYKENSQVLGFIHLERVDDLIEEQKVEIKALAIKESERGKQIGSKLVSTSKEWARQKGLHTIYLSCNILRNKAHDFYLKEGFTRMKTSHFFELNI